MIENFIRPTIDRAATAAGRPEPQVIAGVCVAVTDDPDATRQWIHDQFGAAGDMPAYRPSWIAAARPARRTPRSSATRRQWPRNCSGTRTPVRRSSWSARSERTRNERAVQFAHNYV